MTTDPPLVTRREFTTLGVERPDRDPTNVATLVRRGVYIPGADPARLGADERYRARVRAASLTLSPATVFSHESAAVLHGLPVPGAWPDRIHVLDRRRSGGRSQLDVVRHCLGLEAAEEIDIGGVQATGAGRTVFDLALSRPFLAAVVTADALRRDDPAQFDRALAIADWYDRRRGWRKVQRVLAFAEGSAASVGESISRVLIDDLGFPAPVLQFRVRSEGHEDLSDFAWPVLRTLGEFDGEVKYREDRYRQGGSAEDVVIREKNRENRLRRSFPNFARWDMADLRAPRRLERILLEAGLPQGRPRL